MQIKEISLITNEKLSKQGDNRVLNQTLQSIAVPTLLPNKRLMQLEGECRIKTFKALRIAWVKAILLFLPVVGSGIGLLLLKYYKYLRVAIFYSQCDQSEADYFYIESQDNHEDIETVERSGQNVFVYFKNLKYKLIGQELCPVGYQFEDLYDTIKSRDYLERGVTQANIERKLVNFGPNQHRVEIPNYFEYMFQVLTKPFFLLQYLICIMLIFEKNNIFVYMYLSFSFTTTTINYILLYISFLRIKQIAEKQYDVRVIRNGQEMVILSHALVPGDVVIPQKDEEITFDGILMQGEVFVNEASLTGQSIPIGKFPSQDLQSTKKENTWLFEGSKVLESRATSRVVVINTGYTTRRGRIIRKILTRTSKLPQFYTKGILFLCFNLSIGLVLYLGTVKLMIGNVIDTFVGFRFMDVLGWCFPPSFPIFFNLAFTYSLIRLKYKKIFGTEPEKTTESADIRTFCFDKTGTLTQNEIEVHQVVKFKSETQHQNITEGVQDPSNALIFKLFASCHTVREIHGSYLGDEVDLRMYLHSGYKMSVPASGNIRFTVSNDKGDVVQVLRINQFQSKFQNMSVLARDTRTDKYYAFIKGAPERIDRNSVFKYKDFEHMVASFSLGGYRTIAYAYKQVPKQKLTIFLEGERQVFENGVSALGMVAFENKLKGDTRETIDKLIQSDIEPKMITGDNIYIAVQTGYRAGILRPDEKVLLLEGRKQQKSDSANRTFKGITIQKKGDEITKKPVELKQNEDYMTQEEYALAIDNDFLTLSPEPVLTRRTKLFARISPQNKAKIVKRFIDQEKEEFESRSCAQKIFGKNRSKVGMCGDGANDLMAIREADIGIGISDSDASYGASFNISEMLDVQHIIRQSKNTAQSIIDIICYFTSISFLRNISAIILVTEVSNLGPMALVYINFAHSLFLVSFLSISAPVKQPTKKRPDTNMLSLRNQFVYWTNVIIPAAGIIASYFFLTTSPLYVPNQKRVVTMESGYVGLKCQAQTVVFLVLNLAYIVNSFTSFTSKPYREPIYKNIPLIVTITGNLIAGIVIFFYTDQFPKTFAFVSIPQFEAGMMILIMGGALLLALIIVEVFKRKKADQ